MDYKDCICIIIRSYLDALTAFEAEFMEFVATSDHLFGRIDRFTALRAFRMLDRLEWHYFFVDNDNKTQEACESGAFNTALSSNTLKLSLSKGYVA